MIVPKLWFALAGAVLIGDQLLGLFFNINIVGFSIGTSSSDGSLDIFPVIIGLLLLGFGLSKKTKVSNKS